MEMSLPSRTVRPDEHCYLIIDPVLVTTNSKQHFYEAYASNSKMLLFFETILNNHLDVSPILIKVSEDTTDIISLFLKDENVQTGICIVTSMSMQELKKHFVSFIFPTRYDDAQLLWRLYDPLVLHDIDITMNKNIIKDFLSTMREIHYVASDRKAYIKSLKGGGYDKADI